MNKFLKVSSSPHINSKESTNTIMRDVLIALVPAAGVALYIFGIRAFWLLLTCIVSSVLAEYLFTKITKRQLSIMDLSAAVTGVLLAFNLPVTTPVWVAAVGCFFAIIIIKCIFGGIGQNIVNPALAARAVLLSAYPEHMTGWVLDGMSTATPLGILKSGVSADLPSLMDVFLGNVGGCIGEISVIALLIGAAYLLYRKVITWHIPVTYIATVALVTFCFGRSAFNITQVIYELCAGGLVLGAFFMATDYTTSPMTKYGQLIFGIGCGILTAVIRLYGGYAEGVSYSILIMNLLVPMIDKYTKSRVFGEVK
ncbi:MAG: RnfABCDGE type electron transport complex subunit D [Clostridium sp.]